MSVSTASIVSSTVSPVTGFFLVVVVVVVFVPTVGIGVGVGELLVAEFFPLPFPFSRATSPASMDGSIGEEEEGEEEAECGVELDECCETAVVIVVG